MASSVVSRDEEIYSLALRLVPGLGTRNSAKLLERFKSPQAIFRASRTELEAAGASGTVAQSIASGMARGIDSAAHKGALAVGGDTVAVLGCGVDIVYPSENRKLMAEIAAKGLVVSEFPMGSTAFPQNFPIRNRIISGISLGVLIVEGAQYSGSAITAKLAMDQGREVFAIPGNITSKLSWGPNLLIKQGAKLTQDWNDVLAELPAEARRHLIDRGKQKILAGAGESEADGQASLLKCSSPEMDAVARRTLEAVPVDDAIHLDYLLEKMGDASASELIAALFELEMLGLVRQLPGRKFVKVW